MSLCCLLAIAHCQMSWRTTLKISHWRFRKRYFLACNRFFCSLVYLSIYLLFHFNCAEILRLFQSFKKKSAHDGSNQPTFSPTHVSIRKIKKISCFSLIVGRDRNRTSLYKDRNVKTDYNVKTD